MTIKRLAIYCGALQGKDPDYMVEAEKVGEWLAAHQIELVYGGGQHGLMGLWPAAFSQMMEWFTVS